MKQFTRYHGEYKLGGWRHDTRYLMSIIGEIDDQYVVFMHNTTQFVTWMKRDVKIFSDYNDKNFNDGWCIRIKGVDHHIHNFEDDLIACVDRELKRKN